MRSSSGAGDGGRIKARCRRRVGCDGRGWWVGAGPAEFSSELASPKFFADEVKPTAIERGQLTHLVLQYLDFAGAGDELELAGQINSLVSKKLLSPMQARAVDVDALVWLMRSE